MSRGFGRTQRAIVTIGNATKTLWGCVDSVTVTVAGKAPQKILGIQLREKDGYHWRDTKEPWCEASVTIGSMAEYRSIVQAFDWVRLFSDFYHIPEKQLEAMRNCLWSVGTIKEQISPGIWGDKREQLTNSRGYYFPMVPKDIKQQRNRCEAAISRAFSSFEKQLFISGREYHTTGSYRVVLDSKVCVTLD